MEELILVFFFFFLFFPDCGVQDQEGLVARLVELGGHPHRASFPWNGEPDQMGFETGIYGAEQGGFSREEGDGDIGVGKLLAGLPADRLIGTKGAGAVHVEEEEQLCPEEGLMGVDGGKCPLTEEEARGITLTELCRLDSDADEDAA